MKNNKAHEISPQRKGILWAGAYVFVITLPLLLLVFGYRPSAVSFWWDFSMGIGFGAAALIYTISVLTARLTFIAGPFGIDVIYYFHRQIAFVILCLVIAHPLILFMDEPLLLYEFEQPISLSILTGTVAVLMIIAQVLLSVGRCWMKVEYDNWRRIHVLLGVLTLIFVITHMASINYYTGTETQFVLWSLYTVIWFFSLIYVRAIKPIQQLRAPYQVTNIQKENKKTWSLNLLPAGHSGFRFQPGQFAWISVNNSPFALAEHPFSFSTSAEQDGIGFTIKELGDFSATIKHIKVGQKVYVDGPHGVFTCDRYPAPGYVFIAGGIGIAPMMSMLRTMADRGDTRPILLIYGSRSPDSAIFSDELDSLTSRLNLQVVHVYTEPPDNWEGDRGRISEQLITRHITKQYEQYHYFTCGPALMMEVVEESLLKLGIPYKQLHAEIFNLV